MNWLKGVDLRGFEYLRREQTPMSQALTHMPGFICTSIGLDDLAFLVKLKRLLNLVPNKIVGSNFDPGVEHYFWRLFCQHLNFDSLSGSWVLDLRWVYYFL